MNEIAERMAKAAYEKFNENLIGDLEPYWLDLDQSFKERLIEAQRAAIRAIRDPTEAMVAAPEMNDWVWWTDVDVKPEEIAAAWRSMIDEALK
jgi:hydrogenase maturation factor